MAESFGEFLSSRRDLGEGVLFARDECGIERKADALRLGRYICISDG